MILTYILHAVYKVAKLQNLNEQKATQTLDMWKANSDMEE